MPLDDVTVTLSHDREHVDDCMACDEAPQKIEVINKTATLVGDLSEEHRKCLLEIADRCPVHRTLHSELQIRTQLG